MEKTAVKKILVVVLDNLGDTVMASSVCRPLRYLFPQAKIGFWMKKYASSLFENDPLIEKVHASDPFWDTSPGQGKGKWIDFKLASKEIKEEQYDAALILNTEWRRAAACWWDGIPIRIGYSRRKSSLFLTHRYPAPLPDQHFTEDHLNLIERWAGQAIPKDLNLPLLICTNRDRKDADAWLRNQSGDRASYFIFHPFAGDPLKCWPLTRWMNLASRVSSENPGHRFVWICGAHEESALRAEIPEEIRKISGVAAGAGLGLVKSLMGLAEMFVGGDSGPSHIAAALGVPVLGLFGPTHPERSGPRGNGRITILQKDPLTDLSVDEVQRSMAGLQGKNG